MIRTATTLLACLAMIGAGACRSAASEHAVAQGPASAPAPPYAGAISHPRADPYYPAHGTTGVDALHYGLDLGWNGDTSQLTGTASIYFRATRDESSISLDFGAPLEVGSATLDGTTVVTTHSGDKLAVATGALAKDSRHTLVVAYHGTPASVPAPTRRKDIPDLGWTVEPDGEAWSLQEPFGAFTWYPVNDHPSDKAYYDVTWRTTKKWRGISNGKLVSNQVVGDHRVMRWHLDSPASSYLVTAAIGPYRVHHDTGPHGLPITYWVRPRDRRDLTPLRRTPAMIKWLERRLGPYPFDRIGAVLMPTTSAEETQTMISFGPSVFESLSGVTDLLHEYAHQWYGDTITPNNWKDEWLKESFAMYIQIRWGFTHHFGSKGYWMRILNREDQHLRTKYGPPGEYDRRDFAELNVYYCGARMLFRLQQMLGDKTFKKVLRRWPQRHQFGTADRDEWIRFLDRTSGRHLGHFVRHWLTAKKSPA